MPSLQPPARSAPPARRTAAVLLPLLAAAWLAAACSGAGAQPPPGPGGDTGQIDTGELVVRPGDFRQRLVLTGELRAVRGVDLAVPPVPTWRVQVRWLAEDGSEVAAGDPLVEFDATEFTSDLEEKRLALAERENELERTRAQGRVTEAEKRFAIEQKRAELAKAEERAAVPEGLIPDRELEERRLARERARVELAKAEVDLAAAVEANRAELAIKRLDLAAAGREIDQAERARRAMTLPAPEPGIFVVGEHPWEGRKIQEGDMVWVGMAVGRLPDLTSLEVQADLPDVDDGRVRPGMAATCTLDAYLGTVYPCEVIDVAPVAREAGPRSLRRHFRTRLSLDPAAAARARPGMSVKADVTTEVREGVLLAPRAGLDLGADPPRARLAGGREVEVELGPCDAAACVVEGGLEAGARLVRTDAAARAGGGDRGRAVRAAP